MYLNPFTSKCRKVTVACHLNFLIGIATKKNVTSHFFSIKFKTIMLPGESIIEKVVVRNNAIILLVSAPILAIQIYFLFDSPSSASAGTPP